MIYLLIYLLFRLYKVNVINSYNSQDCTIKIMTPATRVRSSAQVSAQAWILFRALKLHDQIMLDVQKQIVLMYRKSIQLPDVEVMYSTQIQ